MGLINHDAKETLLEKIKDFHLSEEEVNKRVQMRQDFVALFPNSKIKQLTPEEYFPGLGKQADCLGYQLEWATKLLGSIKGGSMAKYGSKDQFKDIRRLFTDLSGLEDNPSVFYESDGTLTKKSRELISQSQKIRGMKSGRTVLGKLMSIYYPKTFLPFFSDQDYLLSEILNEFEEDTVGLLSYMKNNFLFLKIKEKLSSEPVLLKHIGDAGLTNDFFYKFLYYCFPHISASGKGAEIKTEEDVHFEALETDHYQKLIHRNLQTLFKNLRYFDDETQGEHCGHYSTEDVGIMDFLCLDNNDNFVVIELKRKGTDETLAQLCRYMGWVKDNLAKKNQEVLGLIVSESKDIKLEYAIKVVPNVSLKHMKLDVAIGEF